MIQPGDTLVDLAQAIWQDPNIAWLIIEVNKLNQTWNGKECSVTLAERQIIDLPVSDEVIDFYRSGRIVSHKDQRLVTIVKQSSLDQELLSNAALVQTSEDACPPWNRPTGHTAV